MPSDYQEKIYDRYLSSRRDPRSRPDPDSARTRALGYYQAKLASWLPQDLASSILDLGCGQGIFISFLLARGYRDVTGVDISSEQTAIARANVGGAKIHEMDLFDFLAGQKEIYDCISALDLIEHLEKPDVMAFLEAVSRALKPGGRLILQTPNAGSPWGMAVRYGDFTHACCFTPSSLSQLLALAGFGETHCQEAGPIPRGLKSTVRFALWKVIVLGCKLFDLVETGSTEGGIYTRVFQCRAQKPLTP